MTNTGASRAVYATNHENTDPRPSRFANGGTTYSEWAARADEWAATVALTVYTKPECQQCTMTFRALDKAGLEYTAVDISEDAAALEQVRALGYMQAPVVVTKDDHWSGFRPDKISALA